MPDISMCFDVACPKRTTCYRSPMSGTVPNGKYQTWFMESPRKGRSCDYFMKRAPAAPEDNQ